ncbi:MAG TPA: class I SAM-dependent methyltransferase [Tepidisphaeraceae bacterium]|nr:class I SAM-dependent methyltransferase [Tepidisphaeraceae bacterium]
MTLELSPTRDANRSRAPKYAIRFPEQREHCSQSEECCEVYIDGRWRRYRLHDYDAIYKVPGLYEQIFAGRLQCSSPQRVVRVFSDVLRDWPTTNGDLRVLDLGAGNGMVGEELRTLGIRSLVGVDILPEAEEAAERDRPGLYDDYLAADLCDLQDEDASRILAFTPNCLVTVAALGFGDIPPKAFITAYNLITTPGWVVFNIKETFLTGIDDSGFSRLVRKMADEEYMQIQAYRRYNHRLSISGKRLHYVAIVARKLRPLPETFSGAVQ